MSDLNDKAFDMMQNVSSEDNKHLALAMAGMIPGPTGIAADITDAALYAKEKKWKDMGLSLLGAIPLLGSVASASKIRKLTKSIKARSRIKRMAMAQRMESGIEDGSLFYANKKWDKLIDEGKIWIDKSGDIISSVGGKGAGMKTGNVYETAKYERYSDYYEIMEEMHKDYLKIVKNMSPEQLAIAKSIGDSPTLRKQMKDIVLKLEKMLPKGD